MKTFVLQEPGKLQLTESAAPAGPLPAGHAVVRVSRVGICGTDWHAYHGRQPFFSYPRVIGHELGVVVEEVNDPATDLKPGDRCAVEPYLNCGKCVACRRGKSNCCANLQVMGVHVDGGMRERVVVPTAKLHKSDKLAADQLALVEMLAIGCHAAERAAVEPGEWVLIVGAGPIGLSVIPFAQVAGAKVIVAEQAESRIRFCRERMKVDHVVDARGDVVAALKDLTDGELPTVVIDATGNAQSMARTFEYVAPGGRIVFVGLFQGDLSFNDPNFHRREITLMGSRNARGEDFKRIIRLIEEGKIDSDVWITHRARCEDLVATLPTWLAPDAGVVKAMVEF